MTTDKEPGNGIAPDETLDPDAFRHFKEIPCDKCGSVSFYDPSVIETVTECFGCTCKRLEEMKRNCTL